MPTVLRVGSYRFFWYPRLCRGNSDERSDWRMIGGGRGIHWPQLDEDITAENLTFGKPSAESQASLKRWLGSSVGEQTISHIKITPTFSCHATL